MISFKEYLVEAYNTLDGAIHGKRFTMTGYHYSSSKKLQPHDKKHFFLSDDHSWASPWVKNCRAHKVTATFKNPAVFHNSKREFEGDISDELEHLKAKGHDGVIYTPHKSAKSTRQAVHFYPSTGIKVKE